MKIASPGHSLRWYRPEIDGLRAVAIIPIVLFHAGYKTLSGGYVGVDVFFVISGYLITSIILQQLGQNRFSFKDFYLRRAKRILPALFIVLLFSIPFAVALMLPSALKEFGRSLIYVSTYSANFYFRNSTDYFAPSSDQIPLLHTWSLAVEEQFYLLYPAALYLLWRKNRERALLIIGIAAIVSFALSLLGSRNFPTSNFYLLPTRAWELLLGAIAAFLQRESFSASLDKRLVANALGLAGLGLIVYSVFALNDQIAFPGAYALLPVVGAFLFILYSRRGPLSRALLSARPVVYIGKLSYSLYLWHFPVIVFARFLQIGKDIYVGPVSLILLTGALSIASFHLIENPIRYSKLNRRMLVAALATASCVFLALGFSISDDTDFYKTYNARQIEFLASLHEPQYEQSWSKCSNAAIDEPCVGGDKSAKDEVVLFGDSHAFTLFHTLSDELSGKNKKLILYTDGNCPPMLAGENQHYADDCLARNRRIFEAIAQDRNVQAVVLVARWSWYIEGTPFDNRRGGIGDKSSEFLGKFASGSERETLVSELLAETFDKLSEIGKKLVIVDSIPEAGWNVPRKILTVLEHAGKRRVDLSYDYQTYLKRDQRFASLLEKYRKNRNVDIVEPAAVLCRTFAEDKCAQTLNGAPLYMDDNHVNEVGAALISRQIVDSLMK